MANESRKGLGLDDQSSASQVSKVQTSDRTYQGLSSGQTSEEIKVGKMLGHRRSEK